MTASAHCQRLLSTVDDNMVIEFLLDSQFRVGDGHDRPSLTVTDWATDHTGPSSLTDEPSHKTGLLSAPLYELQNRRLRIWVLR